VPLLLAVATSHVSRVGGLGTLARHVALFFAVAADHDALVGALAGFVAFLVAVAPEHWTAVLFGRTVTREMTHWRVVSQGLAVRGWRYVLSPQLRHSTFSAERGSVQSEAICPGWLQLRQVRGARSSRA